VVHLSSGGWVISSEEIRAPKCKILWGRRENDAIDEGKEIWERLEQCVLGGGGSAAPYGSGKGLSADSCGKIWILDLYFFFWAVKRHRWGCTTRRCDEELEIYGGVWWNRTRKEFHWTKAKSRAFDLKGRVVAGWWWEGDKAGEQVGRVGVAKVFGKMTHRRVSKWWRGRWMDNLLGMCSDGGVWVMLWF